MRPKVNDTKRYSGGYGRPERSESPLWTRTALAAVPDNFSLARCGLCGRRAFGNRSELPSSTGGIWARKYQTGIENGVMCGRDCRRALVRQRRQAGTYLLAGHRLDGSIGCCRGADEIRVEPPTPLSRRRPECMVQRKILPKLSERQGDAPGGLCHALDRQLLQAGPWIWALEALPVYDAIARLKSQAHWQTDVIAGGLLGTGFGYWVTTRNTPLSVQIFAARHQHWYQ